MDLNQLGRRNLSKEDRDELIRRLAAAGVSKKAIAEKIGLTKGRVTQITKDDGLEIKHSPTIKSTSAAEELEAKQREIERLRAEKDALAFMQPVAQPIDYSYRIGRVLIGYGRSYEFKGTVYQI